MDARTCPPPWRRQACGRGSLPPDAMQSQRGPTGRAGGSAPRPVGAVRRCGGCGGCEGQRHRVVGAADRGSRRTAQPVHRMRHVMAVRMITLGSGPALIAGSGLRRVGGLPAADGREGCTRVRSGETRTVQGTHQVSPDEQHQTERQQRPDRAHLRSIAAHHATHAPSVSERLPTATSGRVFLAHAGEGRADATGNARGPGPARFRDGTRPGPVTRPGAVPSVAEVHPVLVVRTSSSGWRAYPSGQPRQQDEQQYGADDTEPGSSTSRPTGTSPTAHTAPRYSSPVHNPAVRRPRRNTSRIWAIMKLPVNISGAAARFRATGTVAAATGWRRPTATARPSSGTAAIFTQVRRIRAR